MAGGAGGQSDHPERTMPTETLLLAHLCLSLSPGILLFPPQQYKSGRLQDYIYNGQTLQYLVIVILLLWSSVVCGSKQLINK